MNYTTYDIHQFPSGEIDVSLNGRSSILYFRLYKDLNKGVMAGLMAIAKLSEFHNQITVIIPFLPYSRSDDQPMINILQSLGVSKLITVEMHSEITQSEIEIYNITIIPEVIKEIGIDLNHLVIISPDKGGYARAKNTAETLNCSFTSMEKKRNNNGLIKHTLNNHQLVKNRPTLIVDDIIDSGATINSAAQVLINCGAKSVQVLAIHGVLSKREFSQLIDKIYITSTIEQNSDLPKIIDIEKILKNKLKNLI